MYIKRWYWLSNTQFCFPPSNPSNLLIITWPLKLPHCCLSHCLACLLSSPLSKPLPSKAYLALSLPSPSRSSHWTQPPCVSLAPATHHFSLHILLLTHFPTLTTPLLFYSPLWPGTTSDPWPIQHLPHRILLHLQTHMDSTPFRGITKSHTEWDTHWPLSDEIQCILESNHIPMHIRGIKGSGQWTSMKGTLCTWTHINLALLAKTLCICVGWLELRNLEWEDVGFKVGSCTLW